MSVTPDIGPDSTSRGTGEYSPEAMRVVTKGRKKKNSATVPVPTVVATRPTTELKRKIEQLGIRLILTDRMLNAAVDEALVQTLQRLQLDALVEAMLNQGKRAIDTRHEMERDTFLRATEFAVMVDTLDDDRVPMLAHRAVKYAERVTAEMVRVNTVPLWKLVWLKFRRQPLVVYR